MASTTIFWTSENQILEFGAKINGHRFLRFKRDYFGGLVLMTKDYHRNIKRTRFKETERSNCGKTSRKVTPWCSDNAPAHSSMVIRTVFLEFRLEILRHPPLGSDLTQSDLFLFQELKGT